MKQTISLAECWERDTNLSIQQWEQPRFIFQKIVLSPKNTGDFHYSNLFLKGSWRQFVPMTLNTILLSVYEAEEQRSLGNNKSPLNTTSILPTRIYEQKKYALCTYVPAI